MKGQSIGFTVRNFDVFLSLMHFESYIKSPDIYTATAQFQKCLETATKCIIGANT